VPARLEYGKPAKFAAATEIVNEVIETVRKYTAANNTASVPK
jgi:hypothetical protein